MMWKFLRFEIVHPKNKEETVFVNGQFSHRCSVLKNESEGNGEQIGNRLNKRNTEDGDKFTPLSHLTLGIVIGGVILFIVIIVVASLICSKKCRKKEAGQADVNPVYDGGIDYEYDEMENYSSVEMSSLSPKRREVKAEVVDRSSIYGEEEEGWENVVIVDNNPYYET